MEDSDKSNYNANIKRIVEILKMTIKFRSFENVVSSIKLNENSFLRGCSYENGFPVVFSLNRGEDIISSCSYTKYFSAWARYYLELMLGGKISRETNIQNGWHKLEEKWLSFVVFENIRAWFSFMFGGFYVY